MREKPSTYAMLLAALMLASACGGDNPVSRSCDEHTVFLEAREHRRVQPPEDLTPLDPAREMPVPEPSPQADRPANAPCLDLPPSVLTEEVGDEERGDEETGEEATGGEVTGDDE